MADGKKSRERIEQAPAGDDGLNLNDAEVEVSLICLRYFRGDWDMYLDYLQGPRVTPEQRRRDLPLVEQLRDRDRRIEYLTAFLEDEVMGVLPRLSFDGLLKLWEHGLELDPDSEPFPEFRGADDALEGGDSAESPPPRMH
ncbi:MAG TPA: hypothetical protein PLL30_04070 [Candidatus Krumholzibacteria bacterium]|nr:hypothetical protein [Candidatus Krumholzibacteria bacterium]HPD70949.1 hypothetical protein [Candidatus Krumholzibacteria bacterium]HRY39351.1 hypothetical protein [Candidatus Krumholzibacteria bacterium]